MVMIECFDFSFQYFFNEILDNSLFKGYSILLKGGDSILHFYSRVSNNRTIWKTPFLWLAKKDNLMLNNPFKGYGISLNASPLNGMTPFEWVENSCTIIRY